MKPSIGRKGGDGGEQTLDWPLRAPREQDDDEGDGDYKWNNGGGGGNKLNDQGERYRIQAAEPKQEINDRMVRLTRASSEITRPTFVVSNSIDDDRHRNHLQPGGPSGHNDLGQFVLSVDFAPPQYQSSKLQQQQQQQVKFVPNQEPTTAGLAPGQSLPSATSVAAAASMCQSLALPSFVSTHQTAPSGGASPAGQQHSIELSLCVKQALGADLPGRNGDNLAKTSCDKEGGGGDQERSQTRGEAEATRIGEMKKEKKQLIYERLDRILVELGGKHSVASPLAIGQMTETTTATITTTTTITTGLVGAGGKGAMSPIAGSAASASSLFNVELPLKSDIFDACLCFNLLNVRVASSRLLMLEQVVELETAANRDQSGGGSCGHHHQQQTLPVPVSTSNDNQHQTMSVGDSDKRAQGDDVATIIDTGNSGGTQQQGQNRLPEETRQELERNWLKMEQLTIELRMAFLNELARVVRTNGKIMISVFAYECHANRGSASEREPQNSGAADAQDFDQEIDHEDDDDDSDSDSSMQDEDFNNSSEDETRGQTRLSHQSDTGHRVVGSESSQQHQWQQQQQKDEGHSEMISQNRPFVSATEKNEKINMTEKKKDNSNKKQQQDDDARIEPSKKRRRKKSEKQEADQQGLAEADSCCPRCRLELSERKRLSALDRDKFKRPKGERSRQDEQMMTVQSRRKSRQETLGKLESTGADVRQAPRTRSKRFKPRTASDSSFVAYQRARSASQALGPKVVASAGPIRPPSVGGANSSTGNTRLGGDKRGEQFGTRISWSSSGDGNPFDNLANLTRRYSAALWSPFVSGSKQTSTAGSFTLSRGSIDSNNAQSRPGQTGATMAALPEAEAAASSSPRSIPLTGVFQLNRELISETARRLGRRLSLVVAASSSASSESTTPKTGQHLNSPASRQSNSFFTLASQAGASCSDAPPKKGAREFRAKSDELLDKNQSEETTTALDLSLKNPQEMPRAQPKVLLDDTSCNNAVATTTQWDGSGNYLATETDGRDEPRACDASEGLLSLSGDEYTKRHRQSIAVQTFFTKSIEMNADDEDLDLDVMASLQKAHEARRGYGQADRNDDDSIKTSRYGQAETSGDNYAPQVSSGGRPASAANERLTSVDEFDSRPAADRTVDGNDDDDGGDDDGDETATNEDSTTSGWTAPTSTAATNLESSSDRLYHGQSNNLLNWNIDSGMTSDNNYANFHSSAAAAATTTATSSRFVTSPRQDNHQHQWSPSHAASQAGRRAMGSDIRASHGGQSLSTDLGAVDTFYQVHDRAMTIAAGEFESTGLPLIEGIRSSIAYRRQMQQQQQRQQHQEHSAQLLGAASRERYQSTGNTSQDGLDLLAANEDDVIIDRTNSGDLSSFTLATTTTTGSMGHGSGSNENRATIQQRRATNQFGSLGLTTATHADSELNKNNNNSVSQFQGFRQYQLERQQNRRALSETETNVAASRADGGGKQLGDVKFSIKQQQARAGDRMPRNLIECNPADIRISASRGLEGTSSSDAHAPAGREIRSAEPSFYRNSFAALPGQSDRQQHEMTRTSSDQNNAQRQASCDNKSQELDSNDGPTGGGETEQKGRSSNSTSGTQQRTSSTATTTTTTGTTTGSSDPLQKLSAATSANLTSGLTSRATPTVSSATTTTTGTSAGSSSDLNAVAYGASGSGGRSVSNLINRRSIGGHHTYQSLAEHSTSATTNQVPAPAPSPAINQYRQHQATGSGLNQTNRPAAGPTGSGVHQYGAGAVQATATTTGQRYNQHHQWCQSNTFSSSLNSDISTSGPNTKETTEKDSSRRTSTLSGISSIYQQETSIGMAPPGGGLPGHGSYAFSSSTTLPSSSQSASTNCPNMGSIPELATLESHPQQQQQQTQHQPPQHRLSQAQSSSAGGTSDECQAEGQAAAGGQKTTTTPPFATPISGTNRIVKPSSQMDPLGGGESSKAAARYQQLGPRTFEHDRQQATMMQPPETPFQAAPDGAGQSGDLATGADGSGSGSRAGAHSSSSSSSATINIQRVAQTLRTQLRERLSGMRPLNAFMGSLQAAGGSGGANFDQSSAHSSSSQQFAAYPGDQASVQQRSGGSSTFGVAETIIEENRGDVSESEQYNLSNEEDNFGAPSDRQQQQQQQQQFQRQKQRQASFVAAVAAATTATSTPTYRSAATRTETTPTPTPATLKSFFRSTSSAAFNAFASSFQQQHQSASSTPTATTVISATGLSPHSHFSSSSQTGGASAASQQAHAYGDTAQQRFGSLTSVEVFDPPSSPSKQQQQQKGAQSDSLQQLTSPSARSPLSPISSTSTRFFARIRDKFTLSPIQQQQQQQQQANLSGSSSTVSAGHQQQQQYLASSQSPRPVSSMSTSTASTSVNPTTVIHLNQYNRQQAQAQAQSQPEASASGSVAQVNLDTSALALDPKRKFAEVERNATPTAAAEAAATSGESPQKQQPTRGDTMDTWSLSESIPIESASERTSPSHGTDSACGQPEGQVASSSKQPKKSKAGKQHEQRGQDKLAARFDSFQEEYEQLVSARRPSYQRQLDDQVNQIYKMAVEQKIIQEQGPKSRRLPGEAVASSDLDSLIMSIGATGAQHQNHQYPQYQQPQSPSSLLASIYEQAGTGQAAPGGASTSTRPAYPLQPPPLPPYMYEQQQQQQQQPPFMNSYPATFQQQWIESGQQSMESSSSIRSLRSCWFSMPELYAMGYDSSLQSPQSGSLANQLGPIGLAAASGQQQQQDQLQMSDLIDVASSPSMRLRAESVAAASSASMHELLEVLSKKPLQPGAESSIQLATVGGGTATTELTTATASHDQGDQQQQQQQRQSGPTAVQPPGPLTDWPSNQLLYKQLFTSSQEGATKNWTISELNLTSDDIAPAPPAPSFMSHRGAGAASAPSVSPSKSPFGAVSPSAAGGRLYTDNNKEGDKESATLVKYSTLDDSICVSMQSDSSRHQHQPQQLQLLDNSSDKQAPGADRSRPDSQNSTISSTSCAMSDLNSSELQELICQAGSSARQSPRPSSGAAPETTANRTDNNNNSISPALSDQLGRNVYSPLNVSPVSSNTTAPTTTTTSATASDEQAAGAAAKGTHQIVHLSLPECTVTAQDGGDGDKDNDNDNKAEDERRQAASPQMQLGAPQTPSKQRAMSLLPRLTPEALSQSPSPDSLSSGGQLRHQQHLQSSGAGLLGTPTPGAKVRRRSAAPNLGRDVAPAAATLDLRLAARKNRVKLTDLHPITFINDKEFLSSMSSLKNANNSRLDAIFNSPVGRRLSVNAEMAAQQSQASGQPQKPSIKIGLTGYVYIDRHCSPNSSNFGGLGGANLATNGALGHFRRPSLAPNFWRQNHRSSVGADQAGASNNGTASGQFGGNTHLSAQDPSYSRARSASYTPVSEERPHHHQQQEHSSASRGASETKRTLQVGQQDDASAAQSLVVGPSRQLRDQSRSHLDIRRRSMMLERLTESSIEVDLGGSERVAPSEPPQPPSPVSYQDKRGSPRSGASPDQRSQKRDIDCAGDGSGRLGGAIESRRRQGAGNGSGGAPTMQNLACKTRRGKPMIGRSTSDSSDTSSVSEDEEADLDAEVGGTSSLTVGEQAQGHHQQQHHYYHRPADEVSPSRNNYSGSIVARSTNRVFATATHRHGKPDECGAAGNDEDSSSSDDGDIDKLVAQYSVVGDPMPPPPPPSQQQSPLSHYQRHSMGWYGPSPSHHDQQGRRHFRRGTHHFSTGQHEGGGGGGSTGPDRFYQRADERVVKNDMILRQLLLASKAASLIGAGGTGAAGADSRLTQLADLGGGHQHQGDLRRFSAINLYQRDEDVFVANSMKRPPSSQVQMMSALPLLAGTLPVLASSKAPPTTTGPNQQQQQQQQQSTTTTTTTSGSSNNNIDTGRLDKSKFISDQLDKQQQQQMGRRFSDNEKVAGKSGFDQIGLRPDKRAAQSSGAHNQLPVLPPSASAAQKTSPVKSIISGTSGLVVANNSQVAPRSFGVGGLSMSLMVEAGAMAGTSSTRVEQQQTIMAGGGGAKSGNSYAPPAPQSSTAAAAAKVLIGEVDVEEQINRLRQQEKRSLGSCQVTFPYAASSTSTSSAEESTATTNAAPDSTAATSAGAIASGRPQFDDADNLHASGASQSGGSINTAAASQHHQHHNWQQAPDRAAGDSGSKQTQGPAASAHRTFNSRIDENCDLNDIAVPEVSDHLTMPAILRAPGSSLNTPTSQQVGATTDGTNQFQAAPLGACVMAPSELDSLTASQTAATTSLTVTATSWCNPNEQISPTKSLALNAPITQPAPLASSLSHPVAGAFSSGTKSCEPFTKQLDTIIEGRGLLLGAEQLADRSYANKLRRLSGNSSYSMLRRTSDQAGSEDDGWCKCDLNSPTRRLSAARRASRGSSQTVAGPAASQNKDSGNRPYDSRASCVTAGQEAAAASGTSVFDTVRTLARRTLVSFATMGSASQSADSNPTISGQAKASPAGAGANESAVANGDNEADDNDVSRASSTTTSGADSNPPDMHDRSKSVSPSSSLISLDDAENYRTKNKDNKMKVGCSMETSSSGSLSTGDDDSVSGERIGPAEVDRTGQDTDLDNEDEEEDDDDDDDEVEEFKVCYKCNKRICMEFLASESGELDLSKMGNRVEASMSAGTTDSGATAANAILSSSTSAAAAPATFFGRRIEHTASAGTIIVKTGPETGYSRTATPAGGSSVSSTALYATSSVPPGLIGGIGASPAKAPTKHSRRRAQATRRSASMNAADLPGSLTQHQQQQPTTGATTTTATGAATGGPPYNRRKNKWQIQRNLAPKLKRQRSFSANYAPEVPSPVMPPPRRFSAAPMLTCPHRNKHSSSHSSSSLHHAYSIDSSESMITVIPANRGGAFGQPDTRRSSRLSISYQSTTGCSSQAQSPGQQAGGGGGGSTPVGSGGQITVTTTIAAGLERAGSPSLYTRPRSPLSPRSPSRLSSGRLTPNASDTPIAFGSGLVSSGGELGSGGDSAATGGGGGGTHSTSGTATTAYMSSSYALNSGLEPPYSPANTANTTITTTTCNSTTSQATVLQQQQQQQTMNWILDASEHQHSSQQQQQSQSKFFMSSSASGSGGFQYNYNNGYTLSPSMRQLEDDSSLAVENGTSFNSSRNELDDLASISVDDDDVGADNDFDQVDNVGGVCGEGGHEDNPAPLSSSKLRLALGTDQDKGWGAPGEGGATIITSHAGDASGPIIFDSLGVPHLAEHRGSTAATTFDVATTVDPNQPIVCETINDFCARHSREELEYLVSQIEGLRISECFFSERSSTLCMVIEVFH